MVAQVEAALHLKQDKEKSLILQSQPADVTISVKQDDREKKAKKMRGDSGNGTGTIKLRSFAKGEGDGKKNEEGIHVPFSDPTTGEKIRLPEERIPSEFAVDKKETKKTNNLWNTNEEAFEFLRAKLDAIERTLMNRLEFNGPAPEMRQSRSDNDPVASDTEVMNIRRQSRLDSQRRNAINGIDATSDILASLDAFLAHEKARTNGDVVPPRRRSGGGRGRRILLENFTTAAP